MRFGSLQRGPPRAFNRAIFGLGAIPYDVLSHLPAWRAHCRALLPPSPELARVLDIGCGSAASSIEIAKAYSPRWVVGIDLSLPMLRRAQRRRVASRMDGRLDLAQADALRLPFPDQSFDAVTGHSVLYLLRGRGEALAEMLRVLRPGGRLALFEPARGSRLGVLARLLFRDPAFALSMAGWRVVSGISGRFSPEELTALLVEAGFVRVRVDLELEGLGYLARGERP